jgi:hypothetical protein
MVKTFTDNETRQLLNRLEHRAKELFVLYHDYHVLDHESQSLFQDQLTFFHTKLVVNRLK